MPSRRPLCVLAIVVGSLVTLPVLAHGPRTVRLPPRSTPLRPPARHLPLDTARQAAAGPQVTLRALAELPHGLPLLATPDEAHERLNLLGANARVHAQLRGLVAWVKSRLGKDLSLEAGPGLGLAIERRF